MSNRTVRIAAVTGLVAGLVCAAGGTAWADAFIPAIEQPVFQLGLLRGTPLGGGVPDGNSSSATPGQSYDGRSAEDDAYDRSAGESMDPADRYGYWRTGDDQNR